MSARDDMVKLLESQSLHIMQPGEEDHFGDVAGNAYPLDYPLFTHILGDDVTQEKVNAILRATYNSFPKDSICFSLEDKSIGNASLTPPKSKPASFWRQLGPGMKLLSKIGWKAFRRTVQYSKHCAEVRKGFDDGNTWFFENLCISKECQGQNMMMELVGPPMLYLDSISASVVIETHSDKNLQMYRHFGFEVIGEYNLPGSDVKHYSLIRRAQKKE